MIISVPFAKGTPAGTVRRRRKRDPLDSLQRYQTLIFDEFHLYQGAELAHALAMLAMARSFRFFKRLMILTATPHPEVKSILDRLYNPHLIEPEPGSHGTSHRLAVHAVEVTPVHLSTNDPVEILSARLMALLPELRRIRAENPKDEYIPAVVIVNSVVNAIRLEDKLAESFGRESLATIRGLSNRHIRSTQGKFLALGTSAIEVGVDFHCDYLFFEATDAASFMQRFGRVGRHGPGKAIALVPSNVFAGMNEMPHEIDRPIFEGRINSWYPSSDATPWFVTTEYGMVTARALAETFIKVAGESGIRPEVESQIRERVEAMLSEHSERLGCSKQNLQARSLFERSKRGTPNTQWVKAYCDLNQFRTSLPSVLVHDFCEQGRRADWELAEYEADLRTLLKRAVGIAWNANIGKSGMLTIKGIGKLRQVHASEIFSEDDCHKFLRTKDYDGQPRALRLCQDNESTPVSDLMSRKNHIFVIAKKTDVSSDTDWRVPVFESGD